MMGITPREIQQWTTGEHRTSPHGEDVAWKPGYLGPGHLSPHGKEAVGRVLFSNVYWAPVLPRPVAGAEETGVDSADKPPALRWSTRLPTGKSPVQVASAAGNMM